MGRFTRNTPINVNGARNNREIDWEIDTKVWIKCLQLFFQRIDQQLTLKK